MKNVVRIAILVASAGAFASACGKRPLSTDRDAGGGGAGGSVSVGRGGANAAGGAGGTSVGDDCRNHDVDIPSALLTGAVTINGAAADPDPKARFLLRNGANDLVEIPFTGASYTVRVAPGTYDLFFAATGATIAGRCKMTIMNSSSASTSTPSHRQASTPACSARTRSSDQ